MNKFEKSDFQKIPGVGKAMEQNFLDLGYKKIKDLKNENAEQMYERRCMMQGYKEDRCVLYVYRLAVYYAQNEVHDSEKLKWWNWKD